MPSKKHKPEEILGELREGEIMLAHGVTTVEVMIPRFRGHGFRLFVVRPVPGS